MILKDLVDEIIGIRLEGVYRRVETQRGWWQRKTSSHFENGHRTRGVRTNFFVNVGSINLHWWLICVSKYESDCFSAFPSPISILFVNPGPLFSPSPQQSRDKRPRLLSAQGRSPDPPVRAWRTGGLLRWMRLRPAPSERPQKRENVVEGTKSS